MSALLRARFGCRKTLCSLNESINLCSFTTIADGESNYPPEPIPNRPLRDSGPRKQPHPRFPRTTSSNLNRLISNPNSNTTGAGSNDFLERFKLGPDQNQSQKRKNPPTVVGDESVESPPQSPPQDADEIFKKMKETGLIPNAVAMLDGLCKDGLVQEAMKLFGLMREKKTIPEVVIYTAVVDGFSKAQKWDDCIRIFKKMQNNGVVPNAFSYGVLIQGLCRGKRLDEAHEFCIEMLEAGHSPNLATFIGLVDGFCREKGVEEAQTAIGAMKQKGFFVDEKAVREHLEKKGPSSPLVWEAILGKKASKRSLF